MNYEEAFYLFLGLLILIYIIDYFLINKHRLKLIRNNGITKKGKKKKAKNISELDYLVSKFKLNKAKLNEEKVIIWISLINSFIIAITSSIIILLPFKLMWQMLIAFILLFCLIYSLYEIYGRYLLKMEEKNENKRNRK